MKAKTLRTTGDVLRRAMLLVSAVAAVAAGRPTTDTPQEAALLTQRSGPKSAPSRVVVERTNVAGRYAVVMLRGAMMEGQPLRLPLLIKHFGFGWQAIDLVQRSCTLRGDGLSEADRAVLMRGMTPVPLRPPDCAPITAHDVGSADDIEALRPLMPDGFFVPAVRVAGSYAVGSWAYPGGGMSLFRRTPTGWKFLAGGGGALSVSDAKATYGIPVAAACALALYDPQRLCAGTKGATDRR